MSATSRRTPWQRLLDAVWQLNATRTFAATCRTLTRQAMALVEADGAAVYIPDSGGQVRCEHCEGISETYARQVAQNAARVAGGGVLRSGRPRIVTDVQSQRRWPVLARLAREEGLRTIGLFPLIMEGRAVGVLAVYHRTPRRYRGWEREALTAFAYQAALALAGARLFEGTRQRAEELQQMYDQLQRAYRQLQAFHEIGSELVASLDIRRVLDTVARYAAELTGSDAAGVFEYDPADDTLRVSASYRASPRFVESIRDARVRPGEGAIGLAVLHRRPVQFPDVEAEPAYPFHALTRPEGFRAILAAPMAVQDEVVGGLVVWRRAPGPFPAEQEQLLVALAQQSTAAVRNARLFAALEKAYDDTLEALTAALDVRDRDTEGHSRRVAALALAIAREMGLGPAQQQALYRGGLLHDIGKIGIPDNILHKPGPLDEAEWAVMRRHPTLGFQVLEGIDFLRPSRDVVLHHHERFDGRGYPSGLRGEEIPVLARVFAVADAYDAMTSARPYRPPLPREKAIGEIVDNSGTQFDPRVVEAFLRVMVATLP